MSAPNHILFVSRRALLVRSARVASGGALAALLTGWSSHARVAHDATPALPPGLASYPELRVTITEAALQLSAAQVPAGLVVLTVTNASQADQAAFVLGPPPGMSLDAFLQQFQATLGPGATPAASEGFPAFLYRATIPGGPGEVGPGGTAQAVIQLAAGDWAVLGLGPQPPVAVTATTGTPAASPEPVTAVTVTEREFAFTGLEAPLAAGRQLWQVVNDGQQPHELELSRVPDGTTADQVLKLLAAEGTATPAPGELQPSDFEYKGGVPLQSSGHTVWPLFDLAPGRHVVTCFVPDEATGTPHVVEGMIALFDVGAAGTPSA